MPFKKRVAPAMWGGPNKAEFRLEQALRETKKLPPDTPRS